MHVIFGQQKWINSLEMQVGKEKLGCPKVSLDELIKRWYIRFKTV
jgi:hypothetical protein